MVKNKSKEDHFIARLLDIPIPVSINKVPLESAPPVAALTPPWQSCVVVTTHCMVHKAYNIDSPAFHTERWLTPVLGHGMWKWLVTH